MPVDQKTDIDVHQAVIVGQLGTVEGTISDRAAGQVLSLARRIRESARQALAQSIDQHVLIAASGLT